MILRKLKGAYKRSIYYINRISIVLFRVFPINRNLIVFESEGDFSDNSQALYQYMLDNEFLNKNRIIWLVDNLDKFKHYNYPNTKFLSKRYEKLHLDTSYALATCKYFIYDHNGLLNSMGHREGQKIVFLTHGCTFKAMSGNNLEERNVDECYITGKLWVEPMSVWASCRKEKMIDIGYPRCDYFFGELNKKQIELRNELNKFNKVILWMPTYRRSLNKEIDEDYFTSATGLPIVDNITKVEELNDYLRRINSLLVIKIHHIQLETPIFKQHFSNISFVNDMDIESKGLYLYQFICLMDALITDYSSIANDFMLLDKPIIYTLDDYEEYRKSRGFAVSNPIEYFVGYHVFVFKDLLKSIGEISENLDVYKEKRKKVLALMHTHQDGNASKRIIDHLGIKK